MAEEHEHEHENREHERREPEHEHREPSHHAEPQKGGFKAKAGQFYQAHKKTIWIVAAALVVFFLVWFFFLRNAGSGTSTSPSSGPGPAPTPNPNQIIPPTVIIVPSNNGGGGGGSNPSPTVNLKTNKTSSGNSSYHPPSVKENIPNLNLVGKVQESYYNQTSHYLAPQLLHINPSTLYHEMTPGSTQDNLGGGIYQPKNNRTKSVVQQPLESRFGIVRYTTTTPAHTSGKTKREPAQKIIETRFGPVIQHQPSHKNHPHPVHKNNPVHKNRPHPSTGTGGHPGVRGATR